MTPEQESNMRRQLADYAKVELIDLAISLQEVCDSHSMEKKGLQSAVDNMAQQMPVLRAQLDEYEAEAGSGIKVGEVEWDALQEENKVLRGKMEELRDRFDRVQALNEKFQEKLLDTV